METYVVRVWLPDRPGALGQVASRIGAVRGDVVGIEILERGGDRVVDELVVVLPEPGLVELLTAELAHVDGLAVESVRRLDGARHDPGVWALEVAAALVEARAPDLVVARLAKELHAELIADWVMVLGLDPVRAIVVDGAGAPTAAWLAAFVEGSRHLGPHAEEQGPEDVAWAVLGDSGLAVAVGRRGQPFRWRERRQVSSLARIAGGLIGDALTTGDHSHG
jgi:hypothetical protein